MSVRARASRAATAALLALPLCLTTGAAGAAGSACTNPDRPDKGYRMLFDGTAGSLDRWTQAGPGGFALQRNCSLLSQGGLGLLWHEQELTSYSLKLDWKVAGDDNSGIFIGFPDPGTGPWLAVNQGYEVQIDATDDADSTTGAIYNVQAPDAAARDAALRPPGEWNEFRLDVVGETVTVYLNGVEINEFTNTDPARSLTDGHIGIQNHGDGDQVDFRDIQVRELGGGA